MKTRELLHKKLPLVGLVLALSFFVLSMASSSSVGDIEKVADKTASRIEKRLAVLDGYIRLAMETPVNEFILPGGIPEDMVMIRSSPGATSSA